MVELVKQLIRLFEEGEVGYAVVGALMLLGLLFLMYLIIRWAASGTASATTMSLKLMESFDGVLERIHKLSDVLDTRIMQLSVDIQDDITLAEDNAKVLARVEENMPSKETVERILPRIEKLERRILLEIQALRDEVTKEIDGESGSVACSAVVGSAAAGSGPVESTAQGPRPLS